MTSDFMTTIGEVADVFDGPHATPTKVEDGPYFLSISSLENGTLDLSKSARLSQKDFTKWTKRVTPESGDVLFSYETRLGEAALMPPNVTACLGRRMGLLRPNREKVIPEYLLYAYLSPAFQETIRSKTIHGATVDRISLKELPDFPVRIPPLEEQIEVVSVLSAINSKLELNRQTNQTLEQIAQAIFKSWFVDFDPVRTKIAAREAFIQQHPEVTEEAIRAAAGTEGDTLAHAGAKACELAAMCAISGKTEEQLNELDSDALKQLKTVAALFPDALVDSELGEVPEGWIVKKIDEIVSRQSVGKKYSQKTAFEKGNVPILDQGKSGIIGYHNEEPGVRADPDNPIIVFANHTCYIRLVMHDFSAIQNVLPFKSEDLNVYWLYMATRGKQEFVEYKGHWPDFVINEIVIPSGELDHVYGGCVADMFKEIYEQEKEADHLSMIRDALLPKLLSGELQVDDAA